MCFGLLIGRQKEAFEAGALRCPAGLGPLGIWQQRSGLGTGLTAGWEPLGQPSGDVNTGASQGGVVRSEHLPFRSLCFREIQKRGFPLCPLNFPSSPPASLPSQPPYSFPPPLFPSLLSPPGRAAARSPGRLRCLAASPPPRGSRSGAAARCKHLREGGRAGELPPCPAYPELF